MNVKDKMRVGIIGTGWIAEKAAITLNGTDNCEALAVGSRSQEKADAFASRWGIAKAHGSYRELIDDPDVDLVYVGTPHSQQKRSLTWPTIGKCSWQRLSGHAISLLWEWCVSS